MRKLCVVGFGLLMCAATAGAAVALRGGVLPEDQAYKVSATVQSPGVIAVHWVIAPHYYLYRGRMKFIAGKGTTLGTPSLPDGLKEHDPYFGNVEIYHDGVTATVPYTLSSDAKTVQVTVGYQGCHEVAPKICYPPTTKTFDLAVPAASAAAKPAKGRKVATAAERPVGGYAYGGTPAARAAVKAGDAAYEAGNVAGAIRKYKQAITLDPKYADGQSRYVNTKGMADVIELRRTTGAGKAPSRAAQAAAAAKGDATTRKLLAQYQALSKQHPRNPVYPWVVSQYAVAYHLPRSQQSYCEQAVKADPKFEPGWSCLAQVAMLHGEHAKASSDLRRAMQANPDDGALAAVYAGNLAADGAAHDTEIAALVRRFPKSRMVAKALVDAANKAQPEHARITELERLYADAPGSSNFVAVFAARSLYPYYIENNLPKAASLASGMAKRKDGNEPWAARAIFAAALVNAQRALDVGHAAAALASLKAAKEEDADTLLGQNRWFLMKAHALDMAGRTSAGIAVLRDRFVAQPSDEVYQAMVEYGAKVGETAVAVNAATWTALRAKAKRASPFTLERLDDGKPASLADYRGKPVIIDFWFPTCDNCRIAFPYLNGVANKFADKGLTVLAINIAKSEQPLAQPYLHGMGYRFVGLAGDQAFASKAYGVIGAPTTFFVGPEGNILFELPVNDAEAERSADAAVKFMLTGATDEVRHTVAKQSPPSSGSAGDAG